jgi:hypothetical protein
LPFLLQLTGILNKIACGAKLGWFPQRYVIATTTKVRAGAIIEGISTLRLSGLTQVDTDTFSTARLYLCRT